MRSPQKKCGWDICPNHIFFGNFLLSFFWDDDPQKQVGEQSRRAARDEQDEKGQPEPKRADAEKFTQSPTDSGQNPVISGAS